MSNESRRCNWMGRPSDRPRSPHTARLFATRRACGARTDVASVYSAVDDAARKQREPNSSKSALDRCPRHRMSSSHVRPHAAPSACRLLAQFKGDVGVHFIFARKSVKKLPGAPIQYKRELSVLSSGVLTVKLHPSRRVIDFFRPLHDIPDGNNYCF